MIDAYQETLDNTTDPEALKTESEYWHDRLKRNKQQMGLCRTIKDKRQRNKRFAKLSQLHDVCNDCLAAVMRRQAELKS